MIACSRATPNDVPAIDRLALAVGLHVDAAAVLRNTHAHAWVARSGSETVGFLIASRAGDDFELVDLGTAPNRRRQGVASALLEVFIHAARSMESGRIFLEVRSSNQSARALYRKYGFEVVGTRKNYYRQPVEDALCMRLTAEPVVPPTRSDTP